MNRIEGVLLVAGFWLLVAGCYSVVAGYRILVTGDIQLIKKEWETEFLASDKRPVTRGEDPRFELVIRTRNTIFSL